MRNDRNDFVVAQVPRQPRWKAITLLLLCLMTAITTTAWANDMAQAEKQFRLAAKETNLVTRIALLNKSILACPTFEAWYATGRAQQKLEDDESAIDAFRNAIQIADTQRPQGLAMARIAQSLINKGQPLEAMRLMRDAVERLPIDSTGEKDQWVHTQLRELEVTNSQRVVNSDEIVRALGMSHRFGFSVQPSIDIYAQFDLDSHELNDVGREQVDQMGAAIEKLAEQIPAFLVIGHTDQRGSDDYNLTLSTRRAQTVEEELRHRLGATSVDLCAEGHGESELRYLGDTDEDHAVNRRVEIQVVDNCQ